MEKYHDATDESLSGDHSVSMLFFFRFVIISMYSLLPFFLFFFILLTLSTIIFCFY